MLANALTALAERAHIDILQRRDLPGRAARHRAAPAELHPALGALLRQRHPRGLYAHQADAIAAILAGEDICIATPTASGKSLVFMAAAAHALKTRPDARILALYPAKALIQDQLGKWQDLLRPLHLAPGYVDGGVPVARRADVLDEHALVLMTPDVAHAWLMSHLDHPSVRGFVRRLQMLILDETHVYDGVFGSNMAYLLRRVQAVAPLRSLVSSTATVGAPDAFLEQLTGRRPRVFGAAEDGSASPAKTLLLGRARGDNPFERTVALLRGLARAGLGRFLAFGDSRKQVEHLVAALRRPDAAPTVEADEADETDRPDAGSGISVPVACSVLPYRAGYEEDDRQAIQAALAEGKLAGVVTTSALELGLDIGEIDVVLLLGTPPSVKAFWQRFGRAGRVRPAVCLLLDDRGAIASDPAGLSGYLDRAPEPSWLYLDNRYLQYANVLCAAAEAAAASRVDETPFRTLPAGFLEGLRNELNPETAVPADLYPLKQRAQNGPHHEFPLRAGMEKSFEVRQRGRSERGLGTLSYPQVLREAYPGAIYYYLAQPYRVGALRYATGQLWVAPAGYCTTRPRWQSRVFPKFAGGTLQAWRAPEGFLAEAELQVSERVTGFVERRGSSQFEHLYAPGSPYAQRPIQRFFETTGVCWRSSGSSASSEAVAQAMLNAFCLRFGVHHRDLGAGTFRANATPLGPEAVQGACIYDAADGSLRLTQRLAEHFAEVVDLALTLAREAEQADAALERDLEDLRRWCATVGTDTGHSAAPAPALPPRPEDGWIALIAAGQPAVLRHGSGETEEVTVLAYRYTPHGLLYGLEHPQPGTLWQVAAEAVIPIHGVTVMEQVNLTTGETRPLGAASANSEPEPEPASSGGEIAPLAPRKPAAPKPALRCVPPRQRPAGLRAGVAAG